MSDKGNNSTGNISNAGNVNIGGEQTFHGDVTITVNTGTIGDAPAGSDKAELKSLLEQLETELKSVPAEHQADAEKVAKWAEEAANDATAEQVEADVVAFKAGKLKQAAENIKGAMPAVLAISTQIVSHVLKMAGAA